jgi:hypothetical protein
MTAYLPYALLASLLVCLASLAILVFRTRSYGKKVLHATPVAPAVRGIIFAFGAGMLPWEKESARRHLATYMAGIIYHLGVFAAVGLLTARLLLFKTPSAVPFLLILLAPGVAAGFFLLLKRLFSDIMRRLSVPDDYISNLLVNFFLLAAALDALTGAYTPYLYLSAIVLLLYIPLGKIRHCVFFFYARYLLGRFYGRRGTWPHPGVFEDRS